MKTFKIAFFALLFMMTGVVSASSVTYYNNEAAFEATHFSGSLEDFNDTTLTTGLTITSESTSYSISGGVMNDIVGGSSGLTTAFEFGSAVNAFGGDFDLSPGGLGTGIEVTMSFFFGTTEVLSQEIIGNGFFGFITSPTTLFNKVIFSAGSVGGYQETYTLDNLRYGLHTAAVPVPAAVWLFGSALMGLFGVSRRKSSAIAA